MTCYQKISCPQCDSTSIIKAGKSTRGTQRYQCKNDICRMKTFMLEYHHKAYQFGTKKGDLVSVNPKLLKESSGLIVHLTCEAAELDEPWSFVRKKSNQRWIWYAVDHATNTLLAYVFGRRAVFCLYLHQR